MDSIHGDVGFPGDIDTLDFDGTGGLSSDHAVRSGSLLPNLQAESAYSTVGHPSNDPPFLSTSNMDLQDYAAALSQNIHIDALDADLSVLTKADVLSEAGKDGSPLVGTSGQSQQDNSLSATLPMQPSPVQNMSSDLGHSSDSNDSADCTTNLGVTAMSNSSDESLGGIPVSPKTAIRSGGLSPEAMRSILLGLPQPGKPHSDRGESPNELEKDTEQMPGNTACASHSAASSITPTKVVHSNSLLDGVANIQGTGIIAGLNESDLPGSTSPVSVGKVSGTVQLQPGGQKVPCVQLFFVPGTTNNTDHPGPKFLIAALDDTIGSSPGLDLNSSNQEEPRMNQTPEKVASQDEILSDNSKSGCMDNDIEVGAVPDHFRKQAVKAVTVSKMSNNTTIVKVSFVNAAAQQTRLLARRAAEQGEGDVSVQTDTSLVEMACQTEHDSSTTGTSLKNGNAGIQDIGREEDDKFKDDPEKSEAQSIHEYICPDGHNREEKSLETRSQTDPLAAMSLTEKQTVSENKSLDVDGNVSSTEAAPSTDKDSGQNQKNDSIEAQLAAFGIGSQLSQGKEANMTMFNWQGMPSMASSNSLLDRMEINIKIDESQCIMEGDQKRWKCHMCPKSYTTKHNLVTHILDHSGIKPHCCMICGKFFKQLSHLNTHMLTHGNVRPHVCHICNRSFTQTSHIKRHMAIHMEKKPYVCVLCDRGFAYPSELKTHMEKHERSREHQCTECGEGFDSPQKLKMHQVGAHKNEEELTCKHCNKVFQYPSQLKDHVVKHSGQRPWVCKECGANFMKEHHLKAHQFTHTGLKPYSCKICNRAFNQKANMMRHLLIHETEKHYKCETCGKMFSQPQTLKAHQVTHADKKPYQCNICGKEFGRIHNLQGHMHMHNNSKPYVCFCGTSFTLKGNLNRHKKVKHGLNESTDYTEEEAAKILNAMSGRMLQADPSLEGMPPLSPGRLEGADGDESVEGAPTPKKKRKSIPRKKIINAEVDEGDEDLNMMMTGVHASYDSRNKNNVSGHERTDSSDNESGRGSAIGDTDADLSNSNSIRNSGDMNSQENSGAGSVGNEDYAAQAAQQLREFTSRYFGNSEDLDDGVNSSNTDQQDTSERNKRNMEEGLDDMGDSPAGTSKRPRRGKALQRESLASILASKFKVDPDSQD